MKNKHSTNTQTHITHVSLTTTSSVELMTRSIQSADTMWIELPFF